MQNTIDLTETQLNAVRMISMGIEYQEIARELGVDRTTIYRWRKLPKFARELENLVSTAAEETRNRVARDINDINDIVLSTLLDVAQNDSSGSARVAAARTLSEMVQHAQERADQTNVMQDQSAEIRSLLQLIHQEGYEPISMS